MFIYLADTSKEHFKTEALIECEQRNMLLSFAYKSCEKSFNEVWEKQKERHLHKVRFDCNSESRSRVIIDSGAFTAFSSGAKIELEKYVDFAKDFKSRNDAKFASLKFMNLDVIGDQDKCWENQERIEKLGVSVLPIVTYGANSRHLDRALGYDYFALGGLVPYSGKREALTGWLDNCFSRIMKHYKATGKMPKIHILGITQEWICERYPIYSCDSSSWKISVFRGHGKFCRVKMPKPSKSDGARNLNKEELVQAIRFYQQLESNTTKIWNNRGISWNE